MVIDLDERTVDNALFTLKERTNFMICVQVITLIAVLTIVGFHSRVIFYNGLRMAIDMPLLPCITTAILTGIGVFCQVHRSILNYMRFRLICSYLKDGSITLEI